MTLPSFRPPNSRKELAMASGTDPFIPGINNKVSPTKLARGYLWLVSFALPRPASQNGWIIQEVLKTRRRDVVNPINQTIHYWEAWPVPRNATASPTKLTVGQHLLAMGFSAADVATLQNFPFINSSANDAFADMMALPGSRGTVTVKAAARFYLVTLPADFISNNPATQAGTLRSTTRRPAFWTGEGAYRVVSYLWNFTGAAPTATLTTTRPGSLHISGPVFVPHALVR